MTLGISNPEEFAYKLHEAERKLEDAHQALDTLGVPRTSWNATLTLFGRLEWVQEWCPVEWAKLHNAIQEITHG